MHKCPYLFKMLKETLSEINKFPSKIQKYAIVTFALGCATVAVIKFSGLNLKFLIII